MPSIVVLTTSKAEEDVLRSYNLGANCFITKPVTFEGLVEVVKVLDRHWLQIVELPPCPAPTRLEGYARSAASLGGGGGLSRTALGGTGGAAKRRGRAPHP